MKVVWLTVMAAGEAPNDDITSGTGLTVSASVALADWLSVSFT